MAGYMLRPSTLSFGIVKAGCGALSRSVEVENACSDTNLIAASLSDPFHLDSERLVLGPHEKRTIQVSFDPTRVGTYSGELRLTPSRGGAAAASLRAEAHAEGIQRDHFPRLAADCLIILAPSADLTSKSALREALTHVYSKLSLYDFRLGMVTPDGSGLETLGEEHPYLTSWSEKGVAALAARLEAHALATAAPVLLPFHRTLTGARLPHTMQGVADAPSKET